MNLGRNKMRKYLTLAIMLLGTTTTVATAQTCPDGAGYGQVMTHVPTCVPPWPSAWPKTGPKIVKTENCLITNGSPAWPTNAHGCCQDIRSVKQDVYVAGPCWQFGPRFHPYR
jgi:hypothetical protein